MNAFIDISFHTFIFSGRTDEPDYDVFCLLCPSTGSAAKNGTGAGTDDEKWRHIDFFVTYSLMSGFSPTPLVTDCFSFVSSCCV